MVTKVQKLMTKLGLGVALSMIPASAFAGEIYELPTSWRLQQYVGGAPAVYFTGATTCPSGGLWLYGSAAEADRFWSLVQSAKLANRKVGIYYTGCNIDSFYIQAP